MRQVDLSLPMWNLLWAAYPEIDVTTQFIGDPEPRIVGVNPDWIVPPEFHDMKVSLKTDFLWTPDDTLQLLKLPPTFTFVQRLERIYSQWRIPINHSLYNRLGLTGTGEQYANHAETKLPDNVVSLADRMKVKT
jgi:hypothetical protein